MTRPPAERGHEWCSLRLRFEERDLVLLRSAEQVRGADLALHPRRTALRGALSLAKAGHKLRAARPGASIVFDEGELRLLIEAAQFAAAEVQWAAGQRDADESDRRRNAVLAAFPELVERGLWRSFALTRELAELAARLQVALQN